MGNLGWDLGPSELIPLAESVLTEAGLQADVDYKNLRVPTTRPTSFVLADFQLSKKIEETQRLVNGWNRCNIPTQPNRTVFVTYARTQAERAPTAKLRRLARLLERIEQGLSDTRTITSVPVNSSVYAGSDIVAFVPFAGGVSFTQVGTTRYSDEQRRMTTAVLG